MHQFGCCSYNHLKLLLHTIRKESGRRRPLIVGGLAVQIVSILALILAWVYIFDTVLKEREKLESPQEGIVGAIPRDVESQNPTAQPLPANGAGHSGGGHLL